MLTRLVRSWGTACVVATIASVLSAAPNDWAEGTLGEDHGATRDYYNRAGLMPWKHLLGD